MTITFSRIIAMMPFPSLCNEISFFIPLFVALFAFIVMGFAIQRYIVKKTKLMLCLVCFLLFISVAVFFDPFFTFLELNTDTIAEPSSTTFWTLGTVIPFSMNAIANAFLVWFIVLVFYESHKRPFFYVLVIASLVMSFLIPTIGISSDSIAALSDVYFATLVLHLVLSLIIYVLLAVKSFQMRARIQQTQDKVSYAGTLLIGLTSIFLLATLASFIMQEMPEIIPEFGAALEAIGFKQGGCTYFITIGWILSGISAATLYAGYIMPNWLKKLIQGKNADKK
jgi:hypothetical protein